MLYTENYKNAVFSMYEVYKNIKRARKLRGWSQSEMAARLGYADKTAISKIVLCFTPVTLPRNFVALCLLGLLVLECSLVPKKAL